MANEATLRASLQIKTTNLDYRSYPTDFQSDVTGEKGPVPGAVSISTAGTTIDLSELTTPALCKITNLDATNKVHVGIWDGTELYPLLEIQAQEFYVIRLSEWLTRSFGAVTGTGTFDTGTYALRIKAETAACNVLVEAFEA